MRELTDDRTVRTTGFDVGCLACYMPRVHVRAGQLEHVVAPHHLPVLLAVHVRYRGQSQAWVCRRPRPLTR